jgi:uncharacterized membrane protein YsdA (DUF1294 family)
MDGPIIILGCYMAVMNLLTFMVFAIDKLKARLESRRVPESVLFMLCLVGGIWGGLLAMVLTRHKVSKGSFMRVIFILLVINLAYVGMGLYFIL